MITITALKGAPAFSRLAGSITDASDKPRTQLTNFGVVIEEELHNMCNNYRSLEVMAHVIMPDHLHFILFVHENIDYHVGMAIASLKGTCTQRMRALLGREDASFFTPRYHDRILSGKDQLNRLIQYIADNPRRLMIKRAHPDLFTRRVVLTINGIEHEAMGNIFLLRHHAIYQVRVSSKYSPAELHEKEEQWLRAIDNGDVLVSPFISPAERHFRDMAFKGHCPVIQLQDKGFGARYKPPGVFFDLCAQGYLLMIAPKEEDLSRRDITRARAMQLNALAALIAAGDFDVSLRNKKDEI